MSTAVDRVVPLRAFAGLAGACACGAVAVAMGLHGVAAAAAGLCAVASLLLGLRVRAQGVDRAASVSSQIERQALELERLRQAVELAAVGTWQWDLKNARIDYSPVCATMLGYGAGDIDSTLSAWGKLVHPDDLAAVRARVDAMVDGMVDEYEARVRLRAADGSWRTIVDRGRITARDANGKPLRAVGVHVDASTRAPTKLASAITRGRWVVVDDDDSVRTVIETAARRAGLPVVGFADGRAAWQAICESGAPAGIVTDLEMPGMSGVQLAERVRAAGHACPVLLVSGAQLDPGQLRAIDGALAKPFTLAQLQAWLAQHATPPRAAANGRRSSA